MPVPASIPSNPRSLEAIAQRLIATREALDLSQAEFCRRTGIATNTYNQWEMAHGRPSLDQAVKIAEEFDVPLDWIYLGKLNKVPHELALKIKKRMPLPPDPAA